MLSFAFILESVPVLNPVNDDDTDLPGKHVQPENSKNRETETILIT